MEKRQAKQISECKRKKSCKYGKKLSGGVEYYCDYLCMTGSMRPCPADKCTVYERKIKAKTLNKTVDK